MDLVAENIYPVNRILRRDPEGSLTKNRGNLPNNLYFAHFRFPLSVGGYFTNS